MFVATDAVRRLQEQRRAEFCDNYVRPLCAEAKAASPAVRFGGSFGFFGLTNLVIRGVSGDYGALPLQNAGTLALPVACTAGLCLLLQQRAVLKEQEGPLPDAGWGEASIPIKRRGADNHSRAPPQKAIPISARFLRPRAVTVQP